MWRGKYGKRWIHLGIESVHLYTLHLIHLYNKHALVSLNFSEKWFPAIRQREMT